MMKLKAPNNRWISGSVLLVAIGLTIALALPSNFSGSSEPVVVADAPAEISVANEDVAAADLPIVDTPVVAKLGAPGTEDKIQKFTTKRFTVEKGDSIFLFSDGYADQFGGPKGKKYKYAQFQEKLKATYNLPLTQQYDMMRKEFLEWKGSLEQVDDVLVVGIKIA